MFDKLKKDFETMSRDGRRPGAGGKPKYLAAKPITAAEILAHRESRSAALTPGEMEALDAITRKVAEPLPNAP